MGFTSLADIDDSVSSVTSRFAGLIHVSHLKAQNCTGGLASRGGGKASTSFDLKNRNENHILI